MYSIRIQDQNGNLLKDYKQDGIFVLGIEKADNMIILKRVALDPETGDLVATDDDQIVNNKTQTTLKNKMSTVVTESTETTYQTVLYKGGDNDPKSLKITNPKEVVFEGSRDVTVNGIDELKRYYVYAKGVLEGIFTSASEAVNEASDMYGVVTNKRMKYVWESADRKSSVRLADPEGAGEKKKEANEKTEEEDTEEGSEEDTESETVTSSYVKCIDMMLQSGGVYKSAEEEIRTKSLVRVLSDNLDADVLDLSGCSLSDVLYYPSSGTPVMAMTGEGNAVIIMGYDAKNTILYDPREDRVYKLGMNDSALMFERAGNRFITYIPN